jgi:hypothetical protein
MAVFPVHPALVPRPDISKVYRPVSIIGVDPVCIRCARMLKSRQKAPEFCIPAREKLPNFKQQRDDLKRVSRYKMS